MSGLTPNGMQHRQDNPSGQTSDFARFVQDAHRRLTPTRDSRPLGHTLRLTIGLCPCCEKTCQALHKTRSETVGTTPQVSRRALPVVCILGALLVLCKSVCLGLNGVVCYLEFDWEVNVSCGAVLGAGWFTPHGRGQPALCRRVVYATRILRCVISPLPPPPLPPPPRLASSEK